ncbi:MAG: hypothetical protein WDN09_02105 [bacterium]
MENLIEEQKKITEKFGIKFFPSNPQSMIGISKEIKEGIFPIHGLRHTPEGVGTGWFIWAGDGEIPQDNGTFFSPIHAEHIFQENPLFAKYLGLPPGWRFLIDDKGYEDVWFDEKLLKS